ncbi:uncharacterized protein [Salminus brasiliensis]|uniref:uncharacterized protein isoform X2 n=1 Tax=Salminus brasiliensis TaxID=930266 RepID=UPI003B82CA41
MCAGVCPFLPEGTSGAGRETRLARMTKRRAEGASPFCSVPEKKRCRSVCSSAESPLASTPPVLQCASLQEPSSRCRKRPSRPDPLESLPEPKKAPADRALRTAAADSSGKVGGESGAELQTQRPREEEEKRLDKAMHSDDEVDCSEDRLCTFNSFQFWRAPLPEVDLSLLDPQLGGDTATKDSAEAMET